MGGNPHLLVSISRSHLSQGWAGGLRRVGGEVHCVGEWEFDGAESILQASVGCPLEIVIVIL